MMSKSPRWPELVGNSRTNTPAQKKGGKDKLTVPASGGAEKPGTGVSKPSVGCGRSQSGRGSDFTAGIAKVGGSLKRGSLGHHGSVGPPGTGPAPQPRRPALRLCSSRSFSSLHTPSLKTAPFMRSSRSLSRLDQRSSRRDSDHASPNSQDNKGPNSGEKILNSGRRSTSEEQISYYEDQCHGDDVEKMSSSSSVSTAARYHHCNRVKEQTKDGVSAALCAMTSGMRRNWVQAVLKNVRPSITAGVTSSLSGQKTLERLHQADSESAEAVCESENPDSCWQETSHKAEDSQQQQREQEKELQPEKEQSCSGSNSAPPPVSPQVEDDHAAPSDPGPSQTDIDVSIKEEETQCEQQQTVQLVKELEQTQKELSRLQQLNRNLQDELKHERETHSTESVPPQNDLLSNSSEQAVTLQRLQKLNHDLRVELEMQKRSYEEAREAELQRRVDLLAQQAQLLVTGDATALAQAHLEQDRRCFLEQEKEWENCVSSLKSQLSASEEQKKEAESRLTQLQQELQHHHDHQQEADLLQKHLQELESQLCANEEAQAEKESRLQKHLMLLQASQDRERRSLAASLEQAQQHSQDLQEMLDRAQDQSLSKTQAWTTEIEVAQQQLQEELTCTVSAVHKLQEERDQLGHRCQELQNQLSEAEGEVSRLQSRLKTDETQYYNLEHSYERVCEELQLALGKAEQRESETQDMREGYERLLDGKEQELSEVLLKMEVLGNSLEETEVKLNEVLKVSQSSEREKQVTDLLNARREDGAESDELSDSSNTTDALHRSDKRARIRSRSIDPSYQHIVTAGDDPDRFMSVIQLLERKLYVTEEKLKDITQRLEEHHGHLSCQDPHLYSQLTQSRATGQHLSLLLHSQARQSQRFAQESENRCRVLLGRFQLSLNIVLACRVRLQATPINVAQLEKQLAAAAACLQQGERDAEKHQHESHNASKGEEKILHDETASGAFSGLGAKSKLTDTFPAENGVTSVRKCLLREIFVIGKMLSVLQSQRGIGQITLAVRDDEGNVAHKYKSIMSQILALRRDKITQSWKMGCDREEHLESVIGRGCAQAELICAALKFQQRYESQQVDCEKTDLADTSPPELATYEEQVKIEGRGSEEATEPAGKKMSDDKKVEEEKEPEWLGRLTSRLQRRARFLKQLCQDISDGPVSEGDVDHIGENGSYVDMDWMQEQAKLIYLSDRLHLHLEQELQQSEVQQNKLQALCKEQDTTAMDEQEALNHTLCLLQEDNSVLREELERAEQKIISVESGNQRLLEDIQRIEDYHEERMQKLESSFQEKIRELQQIHEEEMKHLHGYYTKEKQRSCTEAPVFSESNCDALAAGEVHQKHLQPQDHGVTAAEEMHRKLLVDLQQQHQMEVAALLQEKDQLLQEETAATMAAIVAMRRAHKQELEKSRQSQHIRQSADIGQLHIEYEKEIQLLHKELEVLSVQHTQKCLENSKLSHELQSERTCLMQHRQEKQELMKKQREKDAMSQLQFSMNGKHSHVAAQTTDFYEMEVILRAREAEMQFLRQEASSLKEELKIARMDKIYAQNKLKTLYTSSQEELQQDVNKHNAEHFKMGPWSANRDTPGKSLKDSTPNTSSAAFQKKTQKSSLTRQIRARSKSLKDGLSVQERLKLFESF